VALVIPTSAEVIILGMILNKVKQDDLMLRLYSNDKKPDKSDSHNDYTEADGFGYAAIRLQPGRWKIDPGIPDDETPTEANYSKCVFEFTGELGRVYGYFVTREVSGQLMWAERFGDGPYNTMNNGGKIEVQLSLQGN